MLHSVGGNSCFKCAQSRTGNTLDFLTEAARVSFLNRNVMVCRQQNVQNEVKHRSGNHVLEHVHVIGQVIFNFPVLKKGSCCSPLTQTLKYTFLNNKNKTKKKKPHNFMSWCKHSLDHTRN